MPPEGEFRVGDWVQDARDPARVGRVVQARMLGEAWRYKVAFGGATETVSEKYLLAFLPKGEPLDLLGKGSFGAAQHLRNLLTYLKIKHNPTNNLFSFQASRTEFHPYQFRPLLRYLESPSSRLLIADEVGLGKTIEAGFILQEESARRPVHRVLIVCPAALRAKWQSELLVRFGQEFALLDRKGFLRFLKRWEANGSVPQLRAIVSLQALRNDEVVERIREVAPRFEMVIVDEIHHCRNMGTISRRVASALSDCADGLVGLSATPVHLSSENLFRVLEALDEANFPSQALFDERVAANRHFVETERLLRSKARNVDVLESLRGIEGTVFGESTLRYPAYGVLVERLSQATPLAGDEIVSLQRNLSDLNLFSRFVARTRRREVHEKRAIRVAETWTSDFSAMEQALYDAITAECRVAYARVGSGATFAALSMQRQVASSVQGFLERHSGANAPQPDEVDDPETFGEGLADEERDETPSSDPDFSLTRSRRFRELVASFRPLIGRDDSKYDRLLAGLRGFLDREPGRKILVFSYFRATLSYLQRRLTADGVRCLLVHGDIPSRPEDPERDERGRIVDEFRTSRDVRVLLSSEVGSEGLDFQFCSVVVNYDLPWNPMVVEQRIGRVDRIGQKSEKIHVLNLTTSGTIEDVILGRLYRRIRIFEESIGELEEILGERVRALTRSLLDPELTPRQRESAVEAASLALIARKQDIERLESEGAHLISRDAYLDEEIARVREFRRFVAPAELESLVREFLRRRVPDCVPAADAPATGRIRLRLTEGLRRVLVEYSAGPSVAHDELDRKSRPGPGARVVDVTFNPDDASADPALALITRFHPVVAGAMEWLSRDGECIYPCSSLVVHTTVVPPGEYVFAIYVLRDRLHKRACELVPVVVRCDPHATLGPEASERLLGVVLDRGESLLRSEPADAARVARAVALVEEASVGRLEAVITRIETHHATLMAARLQSLDTAHESFVAKERLRIERLPRTTKGEKVAAMRMGHLERRRAEYETRRKRLDDEASLDLREECAAAGLLTVRASTGGPSRG